jgi:hypothetical protein
VPGASAHNVSVIYQAIWQTQKGCQSHCTGTSQIQAATEAATTHQTATATGDPASASGAEAVNAAVTVQFIVQTQLGCVAFCYGTTQVQSASQSAQTTQVAGATADAVANALNVSSTFQFVWQLQQGCAQECHDATSTQSSGALDATSSSVPSPFEDPAAFAAWLSVLAANRSATVQLIVQYEEAPCLVHCAGGAQVQEAELVAVHVQAATATLAKPTASPPAATPAVAPPAAAARPAAALARARHRPATRRTWSWWLRKLAHRHSSGPVRVRVLIQPRTKLAHFLLNEVLALQQS